MSLSHVSLGLHRSMCSQRFLFVGVVVFAVLELEPEAITLSYFTRPWFLSSVVVVVRQGLPMSLNYPVQIYDLPASVAWSAGVTGMQHHTKLIMSPSYKGISQMDF